MKYTVVFEAPKYLPKCYGLFDSQAAALTWAAEEALTGRWADRQDEWTYCVSRIVIDTPASIGRAPCEHGQDYPMNCGKCYPPLSSSRDSALDRASDSPSTVSNPKEQP